MSPYYSYPLLPSSFPCQFHSHNSLFRVGGKWHIGRAEKKKEKRGRRGLWFIKLLAGLGREMPPPGPLYPQEPHLLAEALFHLLWWFRSWDLPVQSSRCRFSPQKELACLKEAYFLLLRSPITSWNCSTALLEGWFSAGTNPAFLQKTQPWGQRSSRGCT